MNISLTPELDKLIAAKVASGRYQSASEVVREGLRLLEERDMVRQARLEEVRRQVAVGLGQARRGELVDGEQVFEELERRQTCASRSAERHAETGRDARDGPSSARPGR